MTSTRMLVTRLAVPLVILASSCALWLAHTRAWDLGGRSPILGYDAAQYAVAARELAERGTIGTIFALPIELERHPHPPWPLTLVQPGLVVWEAALFKLVPETVRYRGEAMMRMERPDQRVWLVLVLPFLCYLLIGALLARLAWRLFEIHAPTLPVALRAGAALVIGGMFALDPEAQHFASGGFTELPFTFGLAAALAAMLVGPAATRPLLFGVLLGVTGAFRANMLWLAPLFAIGVAAQVDRQHRPAVALRVLIGYALPLLPWWIYKTMAFGHPGWDLSALSVWDGVRGWTWFSLFHEPGMPDLPTGVEAARLLAGKALTQLPNVMLMMSIGPRGLWAGALAATTVLLWRRQRTIAATALVVLLISIANVLTAALSIPLLRYLFPARVLLEPAGVLAAWALLAHAPISQRVRVGLYVGIAVLALGWGALQNVKGLREARAASAERGMPSTLNMLEITVQLYRQIPPGEPLMSNLGPMLAWSIRRPVVHLATTPDDLEACRRKLDFHHVLLVFRGPERAWSGWSEVVADPVRAQHQLQWNIQRARRWESPDGFSFVWLELGPLAPPLARR